MRRTPALSALLACALASLGPGLAVAGTVSAATAGDATCHDQAATIVGTDGGAITGTEGPDVVVSNGATEIGTGEGDDLVCVTGGSRKDDVDVATGDGDDVIDASASTHGTRRVDPGDGDDSYVGGAGPDLVYASDYFLSPPDQGADTISTGDGYDTVMTGGTPKSPDHDAVHLGAGRDDAWLTGPVDPSYPIVGGDGRDRLELDRVSMVHALVLDNTAGQATDGGTPVITWTGMENFRLTPFPRWEPPAFIGGDGPERVETYVPLTEARLGGGDDKLDQELADAPLLADAFFEGGDGRDSFFLSAGAGDNARRVVFDRRSGSMLYESRHGRYSDMQVDGFDRFRWSARKLEVRGTARPDHFEWSGCHGVVAGRGGDDLLKMILVEDAGCSYPETADLVTRGGPGDDRLLGNYQPDILLGDRGDDVARGGGGADRCVAETVAGCELLVVERGTRRPPLTS